jgi:hypothetical protein
MAVQAAALAAPAPLRPQRETETPRLYRQAKAIMAAITAEISLRHILPEVVVALEPLVLTEPRLLLEVVATALHLQFPVVA